MELSDFPGLGISNQVQSNNVFSKNIVNIYNNMTKLQFPTKDLYLFMTKYYI